MIAVFFEGNHQSACFEACPWRRSSSTQPPSLLERGREEFYALHVAVWVFMGLFFALTCDAQVFAGLNNVFALFKSTGKALAFSPSNARALPSACCATVRRLCARRAALETLYPELL